jgi:amino acid transporter
LIAAASLLVDYVLTVSVSIAAGVAAITSMMQGTRFAWVDDHKVVLCLLCITFVAVANLRGVRESGAIFAAPTYAFVICFMFMIGYGIFHYYTVGGVAPVAGGEELKVAEGYKFQPVTLFLILGAFSNGCSALTGVEAISNGVPAFKQPEARNASATLVIMAVLLAVMFLGTSIMAYLYGIHPKASETVISQFGRIIFTGAFGWFYYVVQITTALILILAANTSFADFPRLGSLLARDRFLPRQFANRGDKLVFERHRHPRHFLRHSRRGFRRRHFTFDSALCRRRFLPSRFRSPAWCATGLKNVMRYARRTSRRWMRRRKQHCWTTALMPGKPYRTRCSLRNNRTRCASSTLK